MICWTTFQEGRDIYSFLNVSLGHPPCQKPPKLLSGTSSVLLDFMMTLWRHMGDGALLRVVEIWKLICSFLDVSLRHSPCQKLLSGTSSVLLDSMKTLWRHMGDGALPRQVEIDVSLRHPPPQKPPRLPLRNFQHPLRLHGWHLDDALENPGVGPLSSKDLEIYI